MAINFTGGQTSSPILQIGSYYTRSQMSYTSSGSSFNASPIEVTMTPSSTSSKVLVFVQLCAGGDSGQRQGFRVRRHRNVPNDLEYDLFRANAHGSRTRAACTVVPFGGNGINVMSSQFIDTPGVNTQCTWRVEVSGEANTTFYINRSPSNADSGNVYVGMSSMIVMEVAG